MTEDDPETTSVPLTDEVIRRMVAAMRMRTLCWPPHRGSQSPPDGPESPVER